MSTFEEKVKISMFSALIFGLVNLPRTYQFTNSLVQNRFYDDVAKCPTNLGLVIHAIVFFVITMLSMGDPREKTGIKIKHSLCGTLIFYLLSSPAIFSLTGSIFGSQIANEAGCPTLMGVGLHALVYFAVLLGVMHLPKQDKL